MVLRLTLLAAFAAVAATTGVTPDPDHRLDPEEVAMLLAAAIGADTFRVRR
jgi:hypothetical protein